MNSRNFLNGFGKYAYMGKVGEFEMRNKWTVILTF